MTTDARSAAQPSTGAARGAGSSSALFPLGHLSTAPRALAAVAKRSMCPTCEGREPEKDEEAYAACFLCAA